MGSKYGWDPTAIYHASVVHNVRDPGRWNYVTFNLSIFDYDNTTGQPQRYTGSVQSGKDTLYQFTISPEDDAVWENKKVPPNNVSYRITTTGTVVRDRDIVTIIDENDKETAFMTTDHGGAEDGEDSSNIMGIVFITGISIIAVFVLGATLYFYCKNKNKQNNPAEY